MAKKSINEESPKEPRKLDILCQERFNGDMNATIDYVVRGIGNGENMKGYLVNLTVEERIKAQNVIYDISVERHGKKGTEQIIKNSVDLASLGLEREQVKNSKVNPYKAPLKKKLIQIAIVYGGGAIIAVLLNSFDLGDFGEQIKKWILAIIAFFAFLLPLNITPDIIGYFKFKKLKKYYDSEESKDNT